MPSPVNQRVLGAAAATLAGLPIAAAAFLRFKYGPTVFEDLATLRRNIAHGKALAELRRKNFKMIDFFEGHARETPDKEFVLFQDEVHTYGGMDQQANKLAHYVQRSGVTPCQDTVAIFMMNEPNFIVSWLAFNKLGLRISFLNYKLRGEVLLHCIKLCNVKVIACGKGRRLVEALEGIMPELQALGIAVWVLGSGLDHVLPHGMIDVDLSTLSEPSDPIPRSVRDGQPYNDDTLYTFTSGTTGLPKVVMMPHYRQVGSAFIQAPFGLSKDDVIYTPLPLYHGSGFVFGFLGALRVGGTIALTTFSVRKFWDDVRRYRTTVIQYIGETCRYLLAQPLRTDDGKYSHKIRYAIGNGLQSDIWEEFQKRFNIDRIVEFYGASDGVFGTFNVDGKMGSVGRYHGIIKALTDSFVIVECDQETVEPLRGPDGLCVLSPPGKTGLMLSRVTEYTPFDGYLGNKSATEKKLIRNVKKKGDLFLNTGDMLLHDKDGYLYFKDRLGDTFRWKGENVATTEVAHVLNQYPGVQEANVYGVQVPGQDGRAGMAALVFKKHYQLDPENLTHDLKSLYDHVVKELPLYACPKFLRITAEMDITGTFKHRKTDLARDGFDPNVVSDPLFFMDTEKKTYATLDSDAMRKIVIGKARL